MPVREITKRIVSLSKSTRTQQFRFNVDQALRRAVTEGLSDEDRVHYWLYKTKVYKIKKHNEADFYSQLCKFTSKMKYDGEIKKDLKRTFPNHPEFVDAPKNLERLRRVLNVFCIQQPSRIGYFQGMNFIAANMLISFKRNEEATFWGLIQMYSRFNLEELFDTATQKFKVLTYQIEVILFEQMPQLAEHIIDDMEVNLDVYTVRWFFSMFSIDLPFEYAQTLLDFYMFDQSEILIRTALAIFSLLSFKLS